MLKISCMGDAAQMLLVLEDIEFNLITIGLLGEI